MVTLNLFAGVVALYARGGVAASGAAARTSRTVASRGADPAGKGILAAGRFSDRRGPGGDSTGPTASGRSATTAARGPSGDGSRSSASAGSSSTSSPRVPTTPTSGPPRTTPTAPAATASTGDPTTSSTERKPTTASTTPAGAGDPGTSAPAGDDPPPTQVIHPTWVIVDDPAGDTVIDGTNEARADGRADIVEARAANTTKGIGLTARIAQPGDPSKDPNWASSSTFVSWELDTNGDARPDFEVEFYLEEGSPVGGVSRAGDVQGESLCEVGAVYGADTYAVGIDPVCIGSPEVFSFRARIFYDTNPKNENADAITDVAPDGGLSRPVNRSEA